MTESLEVVAARDREPVRRDRPVVIGGARGQGRLQDRFDRAHPRLVRRVEQEDTAPPQQMRETRLIQRLGETAIRLPAIALQDAGIVEANDLCRLRQAALDGQFKSSN